MEFRPSEQIRLGTMSRRIEIELTSAQPDGSWTWRAAGAKVPKGVVDAAMLPSGSRVGDQLRVDVVQEIDGITVTAVVPIRSKAEPTNLLELVADERPFAPVVQKLAQRDRTDRPRREGERDRRDRRDRRPGEDGSKRAGGDRAGGDRAGRPGGDRAGGDRAGGDRRRERGPSAGDTSGRLDRRGPSRPSFSPPPEVPQRPKPKRLRPGKARRAEVLAALPEEQRSIAELALQGMSAVRQRLKEENAQLAADGKATMPETTVLKLAEDLLPKLRVAEWMDRAEAALRQIEHLDLRDLRSVVASSEDPMVARDDAARAVAVQLKAGLVTKQHEELNLWYADIDSALAVGRVIRALRLSSQPPKAGQPFPPDLAQRLAFSATAALAPGDGSERWVGVLEAAAFSPVRSMILPIVLPDPISDELKATVTRLALALPQVAIKFGIEGRVGASMPKPLRQATKARPASGPAQKPKVPPIAVPATVTNTVATTATATTTTLAVQQGDLAEVTPVTDQTETLAVVEETVAHDAAPVEVAAPAAEVAPQSDAADVADAADGSDVADMLGSKSDG